MCLKPIIFSVSLLAFPLMGMAQEISKVPSAHTVEESHRYFTERLDVFLDNKLSQEVKSLSAGNFIGPVLARIITNTKIDEVTAGILHPDTYPLGLAGTGFDGVLGLCKRKGDYDMQMIGLIPIIYEGLKRGNLTNAVYNKILSNLIIVNGSEHQTKVKIGKCFSVPETENHILMIESTRYLANQLWNKHYPNDKRFDNEKNGFNIWLLKHLQQFLKKDFEEYNSRPYQGYSVMPILNLVSYAQDERVRTAATMVLDYLSAKFAVQSSRLRRSSPICRQHETSILTGLLVSDHMTPVFAQLAGNTDIYKYNHLPGHVTYGAEPAMAAGISKYRPHDMILDMIINNDQVIEQRIRHDGVESYYKHPKYLLTAGGRYLNRFDAGMKKRDGWAYPTSIMPNTGTELDRSQLVRFEGAIKETKRNNMCQYKNFACGMNFKMPADLPAGCLVDKGEWKFINYNTPACPLNHGYYVAVHVRPYPKPGFLHKRVADTYGTFEVVDAEGTNFEHFMANTMKNNQGSFTHKAGNSYITSSGLNIEFNPGHTTLTTSPISKVNGAYPFPAKFKDAPFLTGNIMTSNGDGRIVINNPKLGLALILDYRNHLAPEKRVMRTGL